MLSAALRGLGTPEVAAFFGRYRGNGFAFFFRCHEKVSEFEDIDCSVKLCGIEV